MGKSIETNVDAYRLVAECLIRLRVYLRARLDELHGSAWQVQAIPKELRDFLDERQSREASINWVPSESADVLDFAGFADLDAVIESNPELHGAFSALAPRPILHARLLELQTILNRVAYVRPVPEGDLALLATFHGRLRRVTENPAAQRPAVNEASRRAAAIDDDLPAFDQPPPVAAEAPAEPAVEPDPAAARLELALAEGKDADVLEALYREITTLADGLWSQAIPVRPRTWEQVRGSGWFGAASERLGLRPMADFYDLHEQARSRLMNGMSHSELQEFLKTSRFAQILVSLRDVFARHLVSKAN